MNSVDIVLQRINSIERRFAPQNRAVSGEFQKLLKREINSAAGSSQNQSTTAGAGELSGYINNAAAKYGVDSRLITAVAKNESDFNPDALSPAGAIGVMQLMPETARHLGVHDINNPRDNIGGGAKYLKELLTTFHGDVTKAVAAYNAGPQAVMKYDGVPPYPETRNYVGKVLQQYRDSQ